MPRTAVEELSPARSATLPPDPGTRLYVPGLAFLLNRWFATYGEGRMSLEGESEYLLPQGEQVFITETEGIRELGLDPHDPELGADRLRLDPARRRRAAWPTR